MWWWWIAGLVYVLIGVSFYWAALFSEAKTTTKTYEEFQKLRTLTGFAGLCLAWPLIWISYEIDNQLKARYEKYHPDQKEDDL